VVSRPLLIDLFCGAGGAAVGYHRAGFDVIGVDINPQPNYPFEFHQRDAMDLLREMAYERTTNGFDVIHASTPCPRYSSITPHNRRDDHPDLYEDARQLLRMIGLPWVMENVIGAPYESGVVLCGSMFDMKVRRHRNFESSHLLYAPPCRHREQGEVLGVYGDGGGGKSTRPSGGGGTKAHRHQFAELMGMPWATPKEIVLAIPPAYTEFIGRQLIDQLEVAA
jgi:DNA (cytosine-5)-methyltransferase 1